MYDVTVGTGEDVELVPAAAEVTGATASEGDAEGDASAETEEEEESERS